MEQEQTPPKNIYENVGRTLGYNVQLDCSVSHPALHILSCPGRTFSPTQCIGVLPSIALPIISEGKERVSCINNLVITLLVLRHLEGKRGDQ